MRVLKNERYKLYETGFSFCRLGHAPGEGLTKELGCFKQCHVAYKIDGDDKQNRMHVNFSS